MLVNFGDVYTVKLKLEGENLTQFLQGLITNDINSIDGVLETYILTPQGKIKHQITIEDKGDSYTVLCTNDQSDLSKFLTMYANLSGVTVTPLSTDDVYYDQRYFVELLAKGKIDTNFLVQPSLYPNEVDDSLVNYTKGCFVGQEVVARMKHLQKNKRTVQVHLTVCELVKGAKVLTTVDNYCIVRQPC
jgi:hypothetical protein